jgi:hypothetical protein
MGSRGVAYEPEVFFNNRKKLSTSMGLNVTPFSSLRTRTIVSIDTGSL